MTTPSDVPSRRLDFLTYAPRSGSTHVARLVAETFPHVLVVPEFRLPEFLLTLGDSRLRRTDSVHRHRLLESDRQLVTSLGLEQRDLRQIALQDGVGVVELLTLVVDAYERRRGGCTERVLLKLGRAAAFGDSILALSPGTTFLHCLRDGRAVVSSLMRTGKAYAVGETMGRDDLVWSARQWTRQLDAVGRLESEHPGSVVTLRYEELVAGPDAAVAGLVRVFGSPASETTSVPFSVGVVETALHPLAEHRTLSERASAWRQELSPDDGTVVEHLMGEHLAAAGYQAHYATGVPRRRVAWLVWRVRARHLVLQVRYLVRRGAQYRRQPRLVLRHLAVLHRLRRPQ